MTSTQARKWRQEVYKRQLKAGTVKFWHYRTQNTRYNPGDYKNFFEVNPFPLLDVARGDLPDILFPGAEPWERKRNNYYFKEELDDIDDPSTLGDSGKKAYNRISEVKDFFSSTDPKYQYQQCLGYGGNGVCVRYSLGNQISQRNPNLRQHIAVKYPLRSWQSGGLRYELEITKKFARSKHIIQAIDTGDIGGPPLRPFQAPRMEGDSSDSELSSGDEDIDTRPIKNRKRRAELSPDELTAKKQRWDVPPNQNRGPEGQGRDFMITEFANGGDLSNFLSLQADKHELIPNSIAWRFWVCLVKMVLGMAFPPRKFSPEWKNGGTGHIDEAFPKNKDHYRRMKRWVHFDIDPTNIFVDDFYPEPDHDLAPMLKLADFGLADEIKQHKRNYYYNDMRGRGKTGYFAPEQFTEEWDFVPNERNGSYIGEHETVGNFGPHTNVWGIANTMFNIITGYFPPTPPIAKYTSYQGVAFITYGDRLLSHNYDHIDLDLRLMVVRCMAHRPQDRPELDELMTHALGGANYARDNEDIDEITSWCRDAFGAPIEDPEEHAPMYEPEIIPLSDLGPQQQAWAPQGPQGQHEIIPETEHGEPAAYSSFDGEMSEVEYVESGGISGSGAHMSV